MEKCKFTKKYSGDSVIFRYSYDDHVIEKFYYTEDDYETDKYRDIDDESDKAYMIVYYAFSRDGYNKKRYHSAKASTIFGDFEIKYLPSTNRLDKIRKEVLRVALSQVFDLKKSYTKVK